MSFVNSGEDDEDIDLKGSDNLLQLLEDIEVATAMLFVSDSLVDLSIICPKDMSTGGEEGT